MIYRIRVSKDSFITNYRRFNVPQTGSNVGLSETIRIFRIAPEGFVSGSASRALVEFDLSTYCSMTASGEIPSIGSQFFLKLKDQKHINTLPTSFDIEVERLSRNWDEGVGHDVDRYADKG